MKQHRFDLLNTVVTAALTNAATGTVTRLLGNQRRRNDLPRALLGAAVTAGAMGAWAYFQQRTFGRSSKGSVGKAMAAGAATSAMTSVGTSLALPKLHRSTAETVGLYAVLAAALATGVVLSQSKDEA